MQCVDAALKQHRPLVVWLVSQLLGKLSANVETDDLIQAGMIGLSDALARFDPAHGAQLQTFAVPRIKGAILDELRRGDWLSKRDRSHHRSVESAVSRLEHRLGRAPSDSEVATELGVPLDEYQTRRGKLYRMQLASLEDAPGDAIDEADNPLALLNDRRKREALVKAIKNLPERDQYVMTSYYEHDTQLKDVAAVLSVSEERVCQIHRRCLARLRLELSAW